MTDDATNLYAAQAAVVDRLDQRSQLPGNGLSGVTVAYAFSGKDFPLQLVYGGMGSFEVDEEDEMVDGQGDYLTKEEALVWLHIRCQVTPPGPKGIRGSDGQVVTIAREIKRTLKSEPRLGGGLSFTRIKSGQRYYEPLDESAVSRLALAVGVESYV